MSDAIDELKIEITAESKNVDDKIDDLCDKIEKLASSLGSLNGKKPTGMQDLQKATEGVSKVATDLASKYKDLGKGFTLKGDTQYLQKQIDSLSNSLAKATLKKNELEASDKTSGQMYEYAVRDVYKYENQIESLKNQLNSISEIKLSPELELKLANFEQVENQVKEITEEIPKAVEIPINSFGYNQEALGFIESYSERTKETVQSLAEKLSELTVPEVRTENIDKLNSSIEKTETKLEELRNKLSNGLVMGTITDSVDDKGYVRLQEQIALTEKRLEAFQAKKAEIENTPSVELDNFRSKILKIGTSLSKVTSGFSKFAKGIKDIIPKITSLNKSLLGIKKTSNAMKVSLAGGLKTVLKYAFGVKTLFTAINKLKTAIKEGMNNLVQFSAETNTSMSLLTNSFTQLKNASAAMVAPLLNALAPALNQIIQICINAVNAVNQLFSALTGKGTWIKAKALTDNYASSVDSANNSIKKLCSTTLGIDELNINSGDTDSSSGSSRTNASDMFEYEDISENWENTAGKLKAMWEDADFTELGANLGEKLKTALDNIPWESIQEKARNIGTSLATLINGAVETEGLGYSIGQTLGNAINTGVIGINAFLDNTHWDSVGKFLGEGANGLVNAVNFGDIGHMLAQGLNAIFETLGEFARTFDWVDFGVKLADGLGQAIEDFNWEENGKNLSDFVTGCLDTIITFLEETDWQDLGNKVADFIGAIDWSGLFERLSEGIGAALGGLAAFVWGLIEDAWNDVVDWWKDTAYDDGKFTMQGLLDGILEKIKDIGTWIKENIFQPFINGFKEAFGIHSPSKEMKPLGEYILLGVIEGFTSKFSEFTTAITDFWDNYIAPWFTLEKWCELGNGILEGLQTKWEEIKTWWSETAIFEWWENDVKPWFSLETWLELLNSIKESFQTKWNETVGQWILNIQKWWKENVEPWFTKKKWTDMLQSIPTVFKEMFKAAANGAIGFINNVIAGIESMVNNAIEALVRMASVINNIPGVNIEFEAPKISLPRIPTFSTGGFPEDGLFFANHNELVGEFSNGKTAVANNEQITEGIKQGVKEAVSEILAPYLAEIAQNTRETADKDFDVSLDSRSLLDGLNQRNARNGYSFT